MVGSYLNKLHFAEVNKELHVHILIFYVIIL